MERSSRARTCRLPRKACARQARGIARSAFCSSSASLQSYEASRTADIQADAARRGTRAATAGKRGSPINRPRSPRKSQAAANPFSATNSLVRSHAHLPRVAHGSRLRLSSLAKNWVSVGGLGASSKSPAGFDLPCTLPASGTSLARSAIEALALHYCRARTPPGFRRF